MIQSGKRMARKGQKNGAKSVQDSPAAISQLRKGRGRHLTYKVAEEMRRLADALFAYAHTHPESALACFTEARRLVKIGVERVGKQTAVEGLSGILNAEHQRRLAGAMQKQLDARRLITVTPTDVASANGGEHS